jgi:hypothetical protein
VRDFIVKDMTHEVTTFEGVLFADGTVVLHALPPSSMTIVFPSWDAAMDSMAADVETIWVNDLTSGYRTAV